MLRSRAVAVLNPASDCNSSLILGIGNAFRLMCLFSSQKSVQTRTSPVFLGGINVPQPHSLPEFFSKTPI
jgi:hypothetical protein